MGQCGNQIGAALWPLILQEYGIGNNYQANLNKTKLNVHPSFDSFFYIPNGDIKNVNSYEDIKTNKIRARVL